MQLALNSVASRNRVRGVTMIEALVTLFIMSIGLLGVAGLQATSIAAGHASTLRSLAVFHSAEIAERMRANRTAVGSYDGEAAGGFLCNGTISSCTDVQMAADDLLQWTDSLLVSFANMAPSEGNRGKITVDTSTTPSTVKIEISWMERGEDMDYTVDLRI